MLLKHGDLLGQIRVCARRMFRVEPFILSEVPPRQIKHKSIVSQIDKRVQCTPILEWPNIRVFRKRVFTMSTSARLEFEARVPCPAEFGSSGRLLVLEPSEPRRQVQMVNLKCRVVEDEAIRALSMSLLGRRASRIRRRRRKARRGRVKFVIVVVVVRPFRGRKETDEAAADGVLREHGG